MPPQTTAGRPAPVPATAKGEATRAYLLRTAARVFGERGYTATTLTELISASGLTKGAFYFYFRSKSELALAVLTDQQTRWLEHVHTHVLALPTAAEQLRALVPAMLELIEHDPGAWSITRLTTELAADPALAARVSKPMADWVALVADIVRRGQTDGTMRGEFDPDHVAAVLVGAFDGLKALTDVLDTPGPERQHNAPSPAFRARTQTLLALVELALLTSENKPSGR